MGSIFSFFSPKPEKPKPIIIPDIKDDKKDKKDKKKKRRRTFLALKKTGPGGVLDEANVANRGILS
jgi:hypothetical protein